MAVARSSSDNSADDVIFAYNGGTHTTRGLHLGASLMSLIALFCVVIITSLSIVFIVTFSSFYWVILYRVFRLNVILCML